jgi:hypothetical protein
MRLRGDEMCKVSLQKEKHPAQSRLNVSPIYRCIGKVGHVSKLGLALLYNGVCSVCTKPHPPASFPHFEVCPVNLLPPSIIFYCL